MSNFRLGEGKGLTLNQLTLNLLSETKEILHIIQTRLFFLKMRNGEAESRSDLSTSMYPVSDRAGNSAQGFQENPNPRLCLRSRCNGAKGREVKDSGKLEFGKTNEGDTQNNKLVLFPLHSIALVAEQCPRTELWSLSWVLVAF